MVDAGQARPGPGKGGRVLVVRLKKKRPKVENVANKFFPEKL